jgi:hypothetical protein
VDWLQRTHPGVLPRRRIEHQNGLDDEIRSSAALLRDRQVESGLFTGNSDAARRGRELAGMRYDSG